MAKVAPRSKTARVAPRLPQGLIDELERRHAGMARHMARAVGIPVALYVTLSALSVAAFIAFNVALISHARS